MITVGTDSYVTVAEADAYIESYYNEFDNLAVTWGVLSTRDKETYLKQSAYEIENLLMVGVVFDKNQIMQFPRKECYKQGNTVPSEVLDAQIENALGILQINLSAKSDEQMKILGSLGALKNIKYNKREMDELGLGVSGQQVRKRLSSLEAEKILKPWIG